MEFGYYNRKENNYMFGKISELINNGKDSFILYPCGNVSEMAREIICKLDGKIRFCIDNYKNNGRNILSIEEAKTNVNPDDVILICSTNIKLYDELRSRIYTAFHRDSVVDLLPDVAIQDYIKVSDEEIVLDIQYFDRFLNEVEQDGK